MQRALQNLKNDLLKLRETKRTVLAKNGPVSTRADELTDTVKSAQKLSTPLVEQKASIDAEMIKLRLRRREIQAQLEDNNRVIQSARAEKSKLMVERSKINDELAELDVKIQAKLAEIASIRKDDTDWRQ